MELITADIALLTPVKKEASERLEHPKWESQIPASAALKAAARRGTPFVERCDKIPKSPSGFTQP